MLLLIINHLLVAKGSRAFIALIMPRLHGLYSCIDSSIFKLNYTPFLMSNDQRMK